MKLSTYKETQEHDKVLIIGLPGTGKSTLAAELATGGFNLHWIDIEHGVKTLMKLSPKDQENVNLIALPDSASYPIAADTIVQLFKRGKGNICWEHGKTDCTICKRDAPTNFTELDFSTLGPKDIVVLDTITQLGFSILSHVTRTMAIDAKLDWDQWGTIRRLTEFVSSQIQALPCNFICIAHLTESRMEDGKTKLVPQFGSSVMSGTFAKAFDHVVYCDIKNGKHIAGSSTNYANNTLTKSRTDFCIEDLPAPSLLPLFNHDFTPRIGASVSKGNSQVGIKTEVNVTEGLKGLLKK